MARRRSARRIGAVLFFPAPTRPAIAALLLPLLLLVAPSADAATRELLTVPVLGAHPSGPATLAPQQAVSTDGSRVVFTSSANNLDAVDASKGTDVFVRDRGAAETIRVSANAAGKEPSGASGSAALSGDGRYVAFLTKATDLGLASGSGLSFDLVRRDLTKAPDDAGAFTLIALDVTQDLTSTAPSISADGDRIAYATGEQDTASDTDSATDVFVRTVSSSSTTLTSLGSPEPATSPSISADGSRVAFITATAISGTDTNGRPDGYVRDLGTAQTRLGTSGQTTTDTIGTQLSLTADGQLLAFSTTAALVPEDTNATADVYLRDLGSGTVARASVGAGNRQVAGRADRPVASSDGSKIAFASTSGDLVPDGGPAFLRDRALARTFASEEADGAPAIAGDGSVLVYPRGQDGTTTLTELYADDLGEPSTDVTQPTLIVPGDLNLSATFPGGRHVRFGEKATDAGGVFGSICSPASGARFKVGSTTVTCLAADRAGNETTKTFTVTVVDRQAPRLSVPDSVSLIAPAGGKAPLDTLIKATDNVEGAAPVPTCTPAAGALLSAGTTTVNCQVTDAAGNSGEGSFPVKVTEAATVPSAIASTVITNEKARGVAVQFTLGAAPTVDTKVPVTVAAGTARAGEDYATDYDGEVTVKAGTRAASLFIKLTDDTRPEDEESFEVRFDGAGARPAATGVVTVRDDDGPREDKRRKDVGPMVWVDDSGHRLLVLDGDSDDPRVIAYERGRIIVDPQVSPDGTEVLYTADRQVWRRPIEGGPAEPVDRASDMGADHPTWRPDGEAFVYLAHEGPATWLHYESLVDDRESFSYSVPNQTDDPVSWNPAGTQLLITESAERRDNVWQQSNVAIMDAETGEVVRRWITPDLDREAEWSPDGQSVVFLRSQRIDGGPVNTYAGETVARLDIATGTVTDLTPPADKASGSTYGPPSWSADGKTIAFVDRDKRRGTGNPFRIATVSAAGGPISTRMDFADPARQDLVPDQGYLDWAGLAAGGPTDEGRIVFARASADGSSSRLLSIHADGSDEQVVTQLGTKSSAPSVAADGTWLAWASNRERPTGEIYISTPGGRAIERVTTNTEVDDQPALSGDGQRVAFVRGTGTARAIWVYDRLEGTEKLVVPAGVDGVGEPTFVGGSDTIGYVKGGSVPEIRAINLDGTGDRRLTDGSAPAFDRRGSTLAFQRAVGAEAPQIYVAEADGSNSEKLTEEPGGATHPAFGPDARSITYASRLGISATTTDGGQAFLLTTEPTDGQPTWARVAVAPKLRIEDAATTEGTGGVTPVGLVLAIDRPIDDPVTVLFTAADDSAKAPRDYAAKGPVTVTIPAGDLTTTEGVDVQADPMDEPEESFTVGLTGAAGATIERATATVSIRDDDDPPVLSVADVTMPERDLGDTDAVFTLKLSAESGWTVGAHATTAHVTTNDDDLRPQSVDVSWAPGVLEQTVHVPIVGDTQNEPDETFTLGITGQSHVTGPGDPATGKLVNDDAVGKLPDTGIVGAPGVLITTPTPTFEFIGSVPRGQFQCRTDALAWAPCATPFRIRAVADGPHTFAVRALDGDLIDPSPATYAFTVDTVAPSTTITAGPARVSAVKTPIIALATDDASAGFQCRLDDAAWNPCAAKFQLPALSDGNHAFAARAIDPAGNVDSTPAAIAFRVDSRAPQTLWNDPTVPQGTTTPTSTAASVGVTAGAQPKLAMDASGVVGVPVTCASASTQPCTGKVVVDEVTAGKKSAAAIAQPLAAGASILAETTYSVAPGMTEAVALRLGDAARFKVERKGRLSARALVTSATGSAAPVPLTLLADALAPRLLDAGTRQRVGSAGGRGVTIRAICPKAAALPKNATKAARRAALAAAKAACTGSVELRVDGSTSVSTARLRGTPGRTARLELRLTKPAAARVASTTSTPASLRLTWGLVPVQAKTVVLTLTRGASR